MCNFAVQLKQTQHCELTKLQCIYIKESSLGDIFIYEVANTLCFYIPTPPPLHLMEGVSGVHKICTICGEAI